MTSTTSRLAAALAVALACAPFRAGATLRLVDDELRLRPSLATPWLLLAAASPSPAPPAAVTTGGEAAPAPATDLEFDLLGTAAAPPSVDMAALRRRRTMLGAHQAVGLTLLGLQIATTVLGQLNYSDRFGGPSTGRYERPHAVLAYTTLGVFELNAILALLAPSPIKKPLAMDRVMLHRIGLFTAAAGMVAQGVLGLATSHREGFQDQQSIATAHLAIGYVTLAAMLAGVAALVL